MVSLPRGKGPSASRAPAALASPARPVTALALPHRRGGARRMLGALCVPGWLAGWRAAGWLGEGPAALSAAPAATRGSP